MKFGITIKPDMSVERIVALTRQAEASGFEYGWIFDSHVLWLEPYPMLTLMATNTKKMRLGTCVTNPATRDITVTSSLFATLNLISDGRMQLGIGRGDSSRRVLGKKPVTSAISPVARKQNMTDRRRGFHGRVAVFRQYGLRDTDRKYSNSPAESRTASSCSLPIPT
jgi:alkanesulfonate monooxygenase SsuD/methylene tetrahydromethanopterin reductase-like flavin-dependent oxidoreductase (luciferase family)